MNRVGAVAIVNHHFQNDGHNLLPTFQNTVRQPQHICSWGCSHHSGTEILPTHGSSSSQCSSLFWLGCPVCRQLRIKRHREPSFCVPFTKFYCILIIIILCIMSYDTIFTHSFLIVWDVCSLNQFLMKFYCILIIIILCIMSYNTKFTHSFLIVWDVCWNCVVQESVYYYAEMGTLWHCT